MRTSVGRPRWMSPSTPSTACWSSDARATSVPPDPRRGRGQCARTPDPCTTLGAGTPALDAARPPDRERRFVDVDPWAVLLEQLMEVPEEEPAGRKGGK